MSGRKSITESQVLPLYSPGGFTGHCIASAGIHHGETSHSAPRDLVLEKWETVAVLGVTAEDSQ